MGYIPNKKQIKPNYDKLGISFKYMPNREQMILAYKILLISIIIEFIISVVILKL